MNSAEEIVKYLDLEFDCEVNREIYNSIIIKAIKYAQKNAYNQALEDAVENVKATIESDWSGNTGSEYCNDYAVVDKQSILKLKK
jgi:hypothetical protein